MKNYKILSVLVLAITMLSCATKIPYTTAVEDKYKLGDQEVRLLQFYLAGDITLYNGSRDGTTQTEGGELVIKDEQSMNKIVIPNGTRGVVEKTEQNTLYVSFEEGRTLKFVASNADGKYRVQQEKSSTTTRPTVTYGGEEFFISTTSLKSYLMFKLKNSTKRRSTQKTVKGRKL